MKKINWNQISELGLLERINKEIMHPLGLAVYREPDTGNSGGAFVADDGLWQYAPGTELKNYSDDEVRRMVDEMVNAPAPVRAKYDQVSR